jgi:phage head maturation protease
VGIAEVSHRDDKGLWFEIKLKEKFEKLIEKVKQGLLRASSGSLNYLVRANKDTGEIKKWPIGELTLVDTSAGFVPANDYATVNLKTAFDEVDLEYPEVFVKGDEPEADTEKEEDGLSVEQLVAVLEAIRK